MASWSGRGPGYGLGDPGLRGQELGSELGAPAYRSPAPHELASRPTLHEPAGQPGVTPEVPEGDWPRPPCGNHAGLGLPDQLGHAGPGSLDRFERLPGKGVLFKVPQLPKELSQAQRAFEQVQTELMLQSRRQDEALECVASVEADLSRIAKLAVENEGLHAAERHQKHVALQNLTRR